LSGDKIARRRPKQQNDREIPLVIQCSSRIVVLIAPHSKYWLWHSSHIGRRIKKQHKTTGKGSTSRRTGSSKHSGRAQSSGTTCKWVNEAYEFPHFPDFKLPISNAFEDGKIPGLDWFNALTSLCLGIVC
jgi:hypothetical protein